MRLTQQDIAARADEAYRLWSGGIVNVSSRKAMRSHPGTTSTVTVWCLADDMANAIQAFGDLPSGDGGADGRRRPDPTRWCRTSASMN